VRGGVGFGLHRCAINIAWTKFMPNWWTFLSLMPCWALLYGVHVVYLILSRESNKHRLLMLCLHEFTNNFIVFRIFQGQPHDKFQKITHILILWNFLSLELSKWFPIISNATKLSTKSMWLSSKSTSYSKGGGMTIKIRVTNSHYPKTWGQNLK
jgi:hypothetical protein